MNYVIIGNSTAAIGCIEGIRKYDADGSVTVISDEPYHTYSRPLISYFLNDKTTEEHMKYRDDSFYKDNCVKTIFGKKAVAIDKENKEVILEDKSAVKYDKLLVATGSRPFVPPMDGIEKVKNKFSFMTLDNAKELKKAISKDSRVLVIGAGLIGLKCVEGVFDKVKSVEVVDLADRILPSILDVDGSKRVQKYLDGVGVSFTLSDCVSHFEKNTATLKSGKVIDFDIVVLAVGVRPNTELLSDIGAKVERGIIVDNKSRTSVKDIFAAGDCTQCYDITADCQRVLALLPNAYLQGETAGINMAGEKASFDKAMPMNSIGFFGLHLVTAGSYDGETYTVDNSQVYKKLFYKDDLLKGYIIIGDVSRAGIYTNLIREKKPLSQIEFDTIKDKPQLMAFSKKYREQKLGGAQ